MSNARLAGVLAAVVAASTLVSCADDDARAARDGDRRAVLKQNKKGYRGNGDTIKVKAKPQAEKRNESASEPKSSVKADEPARDKRPDDNGGNQKPKVDQPKQPAKPAESCATDLSGDMEGAGSMPAYADLRRGCLREDGSNLVLTASAGGGLPARMPDQNTNLAYGFELNANGESLYVGAESTADGWTAYLSKGGSSRSIGAPRISGDQLLLTIPTSELGGTERWSWNVESSWLRSTLTTTEYAFDDAPNGSVGSFDRG